VSTGFDWTHAARCREIGLEVFFPEEGGGAYTAARRICQACPVRALCLEAAMQREGDAGREYRGGLWGGLSPGQRHRLAQRRKKQVAA
jgi:WhiB family transcriptional regulator, redox-sensing transcriptional regulator